MTIQQNLNLNEAATVYLIETLPLYLPNSNSPQVTRYSLSNAFEWARQIKWDSVYNGDIDRVREVPDETAVCAEQNI
jgi:hypothetical protein